MTVGHRGMPIANPEFELAITRELAKLKLRPIGAPVVGRKTFRLVVQTQQGTKAFFKALTSREGLWIRNFQREFDFNILLSHILRRSSRPIAAALIDGRIATSPGEVSWMLFEYVDGVPLAKARFPGPGELREDMVAPLIDLLAALQALPTGPFLDSGRHVSRFGPDRLIRKVAGYRPLAGRRFPQHTGTFNAGLERLSAATRALGTGSQVLAHGDLIARNVLNTNRGFCLVDWEFACVSNVGLDAAILWTTSTFEPDWRRCFLRRLHRTWAGTRQREFEIAFSCSVIRFALRELKAWGTVESPDRAQGVESIFADQWWSFSTALRALDDFEEFFATPRIPDAL